MDNSNNVALSDAERNKELFEYEMTEVILQLKGEFAKISGKDLKLETAQLASPKINIQNNIPDIVVEKIKLDTNEANVDFSCRSCVIPDVDIRKTDINYQEAPAVRAVTFDKIEISLPEVAAINVKKSHIPTIDPVEIKMPDISVEIPQIRKTDTIPDVTVQKINVSNVDASVNISNSAVNVQVDSIRLSIPETDITLHDIAETSVQKISVDVPETDITLHDIAEASVQKISVDVPETDITLHDIAEASVQKISVDLPETDIASEYRPADISISRFAGAVSVPHISINADIPAVNVSCDVEIPTAELHTAVDYVPNNIETKVKTVDVADIPLIGSYTAASVTKNDIDIDYIPVPQIASVEMSEVTGNSITIDVPQSISVTSVASTAVNVEKSKIDHDYPAIRTVEIPTVAFKKTDNISVPEKPDFSGEIQSILESIV